MSRECPRCNGHEVHDEKVLVEAKSRQRLDEGQLEIKMWLIIALIFAVWLIATIVYFPYGMALVRKDRVLGEWIVIGPVVLAFLLCILLVRLLVPRVISRSLTHYEVEHHYVCALCEFTWRWRVGKPYPYPPGTCLAADAAELRRLGEARLAQQRRIAQDAGYFIIQQRDHPHPH